MTVRERIATPEGKGRYVRQVFATIADRYDLITRVLSYSQDRRWKRRLVNLANPTAGMAALDLATGTGDLAYLLHARGARVVGLDLTERMVVLASAKRRDAAGPAFLVGDMLTLPFPEESFDLVTTGYGLRNVPDLARALEEMHRVLRRGGQALSLDFNRPTGRVLRACYLLYLSVVGGILGWVLHRDPDTYRYIPASLAAYPGAEGVSALMAAHGFTNVRHHRVLGGLMAIHRAWK
jgi:demethylmenaquinone methyltransferase/2-methoxy-6-polyprenyl-1,4-benzoquinol methylase